MTARQTLLQINNASKPPFFLSPCATGKNLEGFGTHGEHAETFFCSRQRDTIYRDGLNVFWQGYNIPSFFLPPGFAPTDATPYSLATKGRVGSVQDVRSRAGVHHCLPGGVILRRHAGRRG